MAERVTYLHYGLNENSMLELLKRWTFGEERLLHDTYYFIGAMEGGGQLWLRRRKDVMTKDEVWSLSEGWREDDHPSLRLKLYSTLDEIQARLKDESKFDPQRPMAEQFEVHARGRFYRAEAKTEEDITVRIDETVYGDVLNLVVDTPEQLKRAMEIAMEMGLKPSSGKQVVLNGNVVPAHIYSLRFDMLIDDDSEEDIEENERLLREWREEAHSRSYSPPVGSPKFNDASPYITEARRLFNEICHGKLVETP
jgi:hypothetical protein